MQNNLKEHYYSDSGVSQIGKRKSVHFGQT
jgi:hypothetical protein